MHRSLGTTPAATPVLVCLGGCNKVTTGWRAQNKRLSCISGGWKPKIKVWTGLVPSEGCGADLLQASLLASLGLRESSRFPGLLMHHIHLCLHAQFSTVCNHLNREIISNHLFTRFSFCGTPATLGKGPILPQDDLILTILAMTPFSIRPATPFWNFSYVCIDHLIFIVLPVTETVQFFHPFFSLCFT